MNATPEVTSPTMTQPELLAAVASSTGIPHLADEGALLEYLRALVKKNPETFKTDRRQPGPKLSAALALAQGEFTNIGMDRAVDVVPKDGGKGYTFKYATLPAIMKVIRGPLSKNEISLLMYPTVHHKEGAALMYIEVTAYLTHSSGESICGTIEIPFNDRAPQKIGIIISYCRRYLVNALLGIAQEDESDYDDQGIVDGPPPMTSTNLTPGTTQPRRDAEKAAAAAKPPEVKQTAATAPSNGTPAAPPPSPPAGVPSGGPAKSSDETESDFSLQFDEAKTEPEITKIAAGINDVKHLLTIEAQARLTAKFKKRREEIRKALAGT